MEAAVVSLRAAQVPAQLPGIAGHRGDTADAGKAVGGVDRRRWLAHRPLGSIMRSRRAAYPASSDFRHRFNGIEPQEPSDIKELPA
ncbi:hypothetical protein [Streptomyces sp. NPDC001652]|uniref:hypothetical protein n=1 Tax=Streptomyces sp. NPDC001652 TaxID=3154393 RepID=UPI00332E34CF